MRALPFVLTTAALFVLTHLGGTAEIGLLEGAGMRGTGLWASPESQFTVQPTAMWGGYRDQPARSLGTDVWRVIQSIPVGGYHRETWRLISPYGDRWSARFIATLKIETDGEYTFYFQSDDGCRVWIDDKQIMDAWIPRSNLISEAKVQLAAGEHAVRCEYMEIGGYAQAHFRWQGPGFDEQVVPASVTSADGQPGWGAEYFLNQDLQGEPKTAHHEVLDFDWADGGPAVFGAGPPIANLDWARLGDGVMVGELRVPEKAHAGLVVHAIGTGTLGFDVWGNDLVGYATLVNGTRPGEFRLRALSDGAVFAAGNPVGVPSLWAPGDKPLLFMAGVDELSAMSAVQARAALQNAMASGLNAEFPLLSEDGWAYLFNGRNLSKWRLRHPGGAQSWSVENGEMVNAGHGTDIYSEFRLTDCELHLEFNVPQGSNSGVYLQGRYEVQVHDSYGQDINPGACGAIYGEAQPKINACKPAGEWQTFDIAFRGARPSLDGGLARHARIAIIQNGIPIIEDLELTGVTGGAMDADEWRAHGIMLQGDHGAVRYRNIRVRPIRPNDES